MRSPIAHRPSQLPALFALVVLALLSTGCNYLNSISFAKEGEGALNIRANDESGNRLSGSFARGSYEFTDDNHVTIVLIDGPEEAPTQVVTIRMFWEPRAGKTPVDPDATNATIHYIIFPAGGNEVGVYSGAGYIYPKNEPGGQTLNGGVWQANLILSDRSPAFADQLGPASANGGFSAKRDDLGTRETIRRINTIVNSRLDYPRLVSRPAGVRLAAGRADPRP